jgi:hypothetical protein
LKISEFTARVVRPRDSELLLPDIDLPPD